MRLLIFLLIIVVLFSGSGVYAYDQYGAWSFTPVGILLIVILGFYALRWTRSR
ncbi:hypothetical protein sos41_32720 [Alphaproteobacteria bacterium SO-S41]|nr:hypothetical protein sos41_32720 [Alphaproteobacteria bacterium SO-S41]